MFIHLLPIQYCSLVSNIRTDEDRHTEIERLVYKELDILPVLHVPYSCLNCVRFTDRGPRTSYPRTLTLENNVDVDRFEPLSEKLILRHLTILLFLFLIKVNF